MAATVSVALVAASACEFTQLPDGGFRLVPDNPSGERVLIIGDSLVRQPSLSVAFGTMNAGTETLVQAVNTAGLVSGPVKYDERLAELLASFKPTVVLMGFSGNFTAPYWDGYSPPGAVGSAEYQAWINTQRASTDFLDRYVAAAKRLTGLAELAGAQVYWVETPPFPAAYGNPSMPQKLWTRFNADLPDDHANVKFLTANTAVSTPTGGWRQFKTICGTNYEIRSLAYDGGVHFTSDGAGTYGRALTRALSSAEGWSAPPQQCPGQSD